MSRLNPQSKPFPPSPYSSSATITSWTSSSSSPPQPTSLGTSGTAGEEEPFPYAVGLPQPRAAATAVKSFGHGWSSSPIGGGTGTRAPALSSIIRARSPSAPNLTATAHGGVTIIPPVARRSVPFPTATAATGRGASMHHESVGRWRAGVQPLHEDEGEVDVFLPATGGNGNGHGVGVGVGLGGLSASRSVPVFNHTTPSSPTLAFNTNGSSRNIYISELPAQYRESHLEAWASQFGRVLSIKLDVSPAGACSRAFVMFQDIYAAHKFYANLKRQGMACEYAKEDYATVHKSLEDPTSANLYIQGFLPDDSIEFCRQVLAPGEIVSCSKPSDTQGRPRGILMARLQSRPQADEAIERLNGKYVHPVTGNLLIVRIADSEAQKAYKRKTDQEKTDKYPSMPDMRYGQSKMLNIQYGGPGSGDVSRQTSYASLRTPASAHFSASASGSFSTTATRPQPQLQHKASTLSMGSGNQWSSRQHWAPGQQECSYPNPQCKYDTEEHEYEYEGEYDGAAAAAAPAPGSGGRFPYVDPSSVRF